MTIFKYALLRGIKNPVSIAGNFIIPLVLIFFDGLWISDYPNGFYFFGFILIYGAFTIARGILNDRQDGTVIRILAGPVTTLRYLTENLLACMIPMNALTAVIIIIGSFLYDWKISFALSLMMCYTIFIAACVSFVFAWSCLFKSKEVSNTVFSVAAMIMAIMGGLTIPHDMLPEPLRYAGAIFPTHWLSNGISTLLNSGVTGEYWLSLAAMILFAVAYLLYGGKRRII